MSMPGLLTIRRVPFWAASIAVLFPVAIVSAADKSTADKSSVEKGPTAASGGFVSLFDGKSLDGWTGAVDGYEVVDGAIVCSQKKGGNLFTEREFSDFVLRLEIKIPPGGNNGIGIRAPVNAGDVAYSGMEIQVLDDPAPVYKDIQPYQHHGSVYGIVPAKPGALKPAGEWNEQEITVKGRRIKIVLNGQTIVDADLDEASTPETMDKKNHPGVKNAKGRIAFLGHGSAVAYRNIRIKELAAE